MATNSGGGPGRSNGRTVPEWADTANEFGEITILQMTATEGHELPRNPFIIGKSVELVVGPIEGGKSENQGSSYILYVRKPNQIKRLMSMTKLADDLGTPITIKCHPKYNMCRCVISSFDLIGMPENEIEENLYDQGVIKVTRITRNENGSRKNTPALILTFGKTTYPEYVKIGLILARTRKFYPKPMLCYKCFQFGHPKIHCSKPTICYNCSEPVHGELCEKEPHCLNCNGNHRPTSWKCPTYENETEIVHLKVDLNITYPEARKRANEGNCTYAKTTAQTRIDQIRLNALEQAVQKKDEQRAELLEANKSKTQQIENLEQTVKKMKNFILQQFLNNSSSTVETQKNNTTTQTATIKGKEKTTKSNKDHGINLRSRTRKIDDEIQASRRLDSSISPNRSRSPPPKIANTTLKSSQPSTVHSEMLNEESVDISDDENGQNERDAFDVSLR